MIKSSLGLCLRYMAQMHAQIDSVHLETDRKKRLVRNERQSGEDGDGERNPLYLTEYQ